MQILHIDRAGWREVSALGDFLKTISELGGVGDWEMSLDDLIIDYSERLGGFVVSDGARVRNFIAYDNGWGWED